MSASSFRGRVASDRDLWAASSRSQVAVQPSEREGFGLFPLEAMAMGLPVVYCESSESAVGELVRPGSEGESTAATPEALAATLSRLLKDPGERQVLAENGRRRGPRNSPGTASRVRFSLAGLARRSEGRLT